MTKEEVINYCKRSVAIGEDDDSRYHNEVLDFIIEVLKQKPKTGHWIEGEAWEDTDGGWGRWQKCSVCRQSKHRKTKFCPNCGAKMGSEEV